MPKLRKMLGSVDDERVIRLMRVIETQSKKTLADWALAYVSNAYLDIYEKAFPGDHRLRGAVEAVEKHLAGTLSAAALKPFLAAAVCAAKEAEHQPAAMAAARAVSTACTVFRTPTSALGFCFYGAAARAYDTLGTEASGAAYDDFAAGELEHILASLQRAAAADEPNPVKINWNC